MTELRKIGTSLSEQPLICVRNAYFCVRDNLGFQQIRGPVIKTVCFLFVWHIVWFLWCKQTNRPLRKGNSPKKRNDIHQQLIHSAAAEADYSTKTWCWIRFNSLVRKWSSFAQTPRQFSISKLRNHPLFQSYTISVTIWWSNSSMKAGEFSDGGRWDWGGLQNICSTFGEVTCSSWRCGRKSDDDEAKPSCPHPTEPM